MQANKPTFKTEDVTLNTYSHFPGVYLVMAMHGDVSIGSIRLQTDYPHMSGRLTWVTSVLVSREYRGRGIGSMLLAKAEELARKDGRDRVGLIPHAYDPDGKEQFDQKYQENLVSFYERKGYRFEKFKASYDMIKYLIPTA